jgi:parallel beta-helix repeat protein
MRRGGVSNAIAAGLLIAGILIGVNVFYVATTYQSRITTQTETATQTESTMASLTTTATVTQTETTTTGLTMTATVIQTETNTFNLTVTTTATVIPVACNIVISTNTVLTSDVGPCSGNGLIIAASGTLLNCAGHMIDGTGTNDTSAGILLTRMTGVTVENCNVTGFQYGFFLSYSSGNTLNNDSASTNGNMGFYLNDSSSNTLTSNSADSNIRGFYLTNSSANTLTGNSAEFNANHTAEGSIGAGFHLSLSSNSNTFTGNTASGNWDGFVLGTSSFDTFTSNIVNDNENNGLELVQLTNCVFTGNNASSNAVGFLMKNSTDGNAFRLNTVDSNFDNGFYIMGSNSNAFNSNTANNNYGNGFYLFSGSSNNTLTSNTANGNSRYGYYDSSAGSGTNGTANAYSLDECSGNSEGGSSPSGLGSPQS